MLWNSLREAIGQLEQSCHYSNYYWRTYIIEQVSRFLQSSIQSMFWHRYLIYLVAHTFACNNWGRPQSHCFGCLQLISLVRKDSQHVKIYLTVLNNNCKVVFFPDFAFFRINYYKNEICQIRTVLESIFEWKAIAFFWRSVIFFPVWKTLWTTKNGLISESFPTLAQISKKRCQITILTIFSLGG